MERRRHVQEKVPLIVISDTHLGMTNYASDMLCEFLRNTSCDTLVLNGDIVDGQRLNSRKPRKFSEAQARVIDAINRKIAEGTRVVYLPGNHDAALRSKKILGTKFLGVEFERDLEITDPKGQRILFMHGDRIGKYRDDQGTEKPLLPHPKVRWMQRALDYFYVTATAVSAIVDKIAGKVIGRRINIASMTRTAIEKKNGKKNAYMQAATHYARQLGYDGIVCGHFHMPEIAKTQDGIFYANSGDWVENFTALAMDDKGDWQRVRWAEKRKELGLKNTFNAASGKSPDAEFRPLTDEMISRIHKIWPGRKN